MNPVLGLDPNPNPDPDPDVWELAGGGCARPGPAQGWRLSPAAAAQAQRYLHICALSPKTYL